jgi:hypothetical protein
MLAPPPPLLGIRYHVTGCPAHRACWARRPIPYVARTIMDYIRSLKDACVARLPAEQKAPGQTLFNFGGPVSDYSLLRQAVVRDKGTTIQLARPWAPFVSARSFVTGSPHASRLRGLEGRPCARRLPRVRETQEWPSRVTRNMLSSGWTGRFHPPPFGASVALAPLALSAWPGDFKRGASNFPASISSARTRIHGAWCYVQGSCS